MQNLRFVGTGFIALLTIFALIATGQGETLAKPDLYPVSFHCVPEALLWGQSFTADIQIAGNTNVSFTVKYFLSIDPAITGGDLLLRTWTVNPGVTGERTTLVLPANPPSGAGRQVYVGILIDADNTVAESNEGNNQNQGFGIDSRVLTIGPPEAWADGSQYKYYTLLGPQAADCQKHIGYQFVDPSGNSDTTWSLSAGALPPGITMTSGGFVDGAPTIPGIYYFTLRGRGTYDCQMVVHPARSEWFEDAKLGYWLGFYSSTPGAIETENTDYNADQQIAAAVNAGAKYIIFSAFGIDEIRYWPSRVPAAYSPKTGRDFVKEVIDAAHRAGIKVLLYFAIDPHGGKEFTSAGSSVMGYQLWERHLIQELSARGPDGFWFDGAYFTQTSFGNSYFKWMWPELEAVIRRENPEAIIMTNPGAVPGWWNLDDQGWGWFNEGPADIDVRTFEQFANRTKANPPAIVPPTYNYSPLDQNNYFMIPDPQNPSHTLFPKYLPAESSALLGRLWGWTGNVNDYYPVKTSGDLLNYLVRCWSGGTTVSLAAGCMRNGAYNSGDQAAMNGIGAWINTYREAVYHTRKGPVLTGNAGHIYTTKLAAFDSQYPRGLENVYLFILASDKPDGNTLQIDSWPGRNTALACYDLKAPSTPLTFTSAGPNLTINSIQWNPDQTPTVLCVKTALNSDSLIYWPVASGTVSDWNLNTPIDSTSRACVAGCSDGHKYRGLLKFPAIPEISGKTITRAKLHMNYLYSGGANPGLPLTIGVNTLKRDWDLSTTWATQPVVNTARAGGIISIPINDYGWYEWDATLAIQEWANGLGTTSLEILGDEDIININPGWQVLKYFASAVSTDSQPWLEVTCDTPAISTIYGTVNYKSISGDLLDVLNIEICNSNDGRVVELHSVSLDTDHHYRFQTALRGGPYTFVANKLHLSWIQTLQTGVNITDATVVDFSITHTMAGDANGDNKVDVSDLGILAANYGRTGGGTWEFGDFNGDGKVDVSDLGILAANYGAGTGGTLDFNADAKALGFFVGNEVVENNPKTETDSAPVFSDWGCGSAGLPLVVGIILAGLSNYFKTGRESR